MNKPAAEIAKIKPNYLYVFVSMTLVLFLCGILGLMLLYSQKILNYYRESIELAVEISDNAPAEVRSGVQNDLRSASYTKGGSVVFISKDAAFEQMKRELGDFVDSNMASGNPLFDVVKFRLKSQYVQSDSIDAIIAGLKRNEYIVDVIYERDATQNILLNLRNLGLLTFVVMLFMVFISYVLINNTIKLGLYANRMTIKSMQLVGATPDFIRLPYERDAIRRGMLSGLVAVTTLLAIVLYVERQISEPMLKSDPMIFVFLFGFIVISGVVISWFTTYKSVNRFLQASQESLY
jgi:cell division transport system permease protein